VEHLIDKFSLYNTFLKKLENERILLNSSDPVYVEIISYVRDQQDENSKKAIIGEIEFYLQSGRAPYAMVALMVILNLHLTQYFDRLKSLRKLVVQRKKDLPLDFADILENVLKNL